MANFGARELTVELPDDRMLKLEHVTDVTGSVQSTDSGATARPLSIRELVLSGLDWPIPRGRIKVESPTVLGELAIDAEVVAGAGAFPLIGAASVAVLGAQRVALEYAGTRIAGDVRVESLAVDQDADRDGHAVIGSLTLRNVQTSVAGVFVRLGSAVAERARASWEGEDALFEAASLVITNLELRHEDFEISLGRVEMPRGIAVRGQRVRANEVSVDEATVMLRDISKLTEGAPNHVPIDLRVLDRLNGRVDVDLTLDATVPFIGRRKATHHFRVPVSDGTINYLSLERDLSALEDAVIDFAIRDDALVLERNVPLLPGASKPILVWDLSDVELALAQEKLVRLRTLPGFHQTPRPEESSFALRSVALDNIDIELSAQAPPNAEPLSGSVTGAALAALTATGRVYHDSEGPTETTAVSLEGSGLSLSLSGLPLGKLIAAAQLSLETLAEGQLTFSGAIPRELRGRITGLSLADATVTYGVIESPSD